MRIKSILKDEAARGLLTKGLVAVLIKGGSAALSFAMFVLLSNAMEAEEYGRFAIGLSLAITLSMVAGLGLGTAVLRFLPQYKAKGETALERGFLRFSTWASVVSPAVLAAVGCLGLFAAARIQPEWQINYLFSSMLLLIVMCWGEFVASAMRAFGYTFLSLAPRDILWRIVGCGFASYFVWKGFQTNSTSVLLFLTVALFILVLWQLVIARSHFTPVLAPQTVALDLPSWKQAALPMWGASALYAFAQQFDIIVVGYFLTPGDSAAYFAALRTAGMLSLLLIAGNLISAPLISKHHFSGDRDALQKTVRLLTIAIALPTICGLLFLVAAGKPLLELFNPAFASAYLVLVVLACGFTFDAVAGPTGYMLQMVGHEKSYLKIMGAAYAFTLVTQCLLAPHFGALGVAIPSALGLILANILIVHKVRRTLHVDPSLVGLFFKVRKK